MKLAALGVVTFGIGAALAVPGLMGIGAFWVVMGLPVRLHGQRLKALQAGSGEAGSTTGGTTGGTTATKPAIDGRTFALGTLLWLVLGVPSLLVGVLEIGFDAGDENWRWLPIGMGAFALGIGGISAAMYLMGSAVLAVAEKGPRPQHPATIRIRAMSETGTYINERPRLQFELLVEPDPGTGLASYEVTKKATVPFTAIGSLRVGDGFKALVAGPEHPTSMEIGWDQPVSEIAGQAEPADVSARLEALDRLRSEAKISDEEYQAQRGRILGSL